MMVWKRWLLWKILPFFGIDMLNFWGVFPMPHSGSTSQTSPSTPKRHGTGCAQRLGITKLPPQERRTSPLMVAQRYPARLTRNSPVDMENRSHYLQGFTYLRWLFRISSINSMNTNESYNKINTTCHCTASIVRIYLPLFFGPPTDCWICIFLYISLYVLWGCTIDLPCLPYIPYLLRTYRQHIYHETK